MKKVSFGGKRPTIGPSPPGAEIDNWVANQATEPMKRLTIDVPISLHKRIKSQCALENLVMAEEIRSLLEKRFPRKELLEAAMFTGLTRQGEGGAS
jgi:hypothetical protein